MIGRKAVGWLLLWVGVCGLLGSEDGSDEEEEADRSSC